MSAIAILTNHFPYYPGEQFFEDEIKYWSDTPFSKVFLLPGMAVGSPRKIPNNIKLNLDLTTGNKTEQILFIIRAFFSSIFFNEALFLIKKRKLNGYTFLCALIASSKTLRIASKLQLFVENHGPIKIIYCYWNEVHAYAACLLKHRGIVEKVVSRVHGYDLYEERRKHAYMPLKRQFINYFDITFALSQEGQLYLVNRYGCDIAKAKINPLGVPVPKQNSLPTPEGFFHVVSVSFCIPVKRIDKIIRALSILAEQESDLKIKWTHIGDGPLFDELIDQAKIAFKDKGNIVFDFRGNLPNDSVKNFYLQEPVDLFINASESEGIPVSIMEAMSCGVPVVAPNVGGISTLVDWDTGLLMSEKACIDEILMALKSMACSAKDERIRYCVKNKIITKFNAQKNYKNMVDYIFKISKLNFTNH